MSMSEIAKAGIGNKAGLVGVNDSESVVEDVRVSDNALHIAEQGNTTAARNTSSLTAAYVPVRQECNLSIISKTTAVTIGGGAANDTHLMGIYIHTALTGTLAITGFADSDGASQTFTIPAGAVGEFDFKGALNSAGALTMTASNAGDDNKVAVLWRPV